jgi:hypothetical protein
MSISPGRRASGDPSFADGPCCQPTVPRSVCLWPRTSLGSRPTARHLASRHARHEFRYAVNPLHSGPVREIPPARLSTLHQSTALIMSVAAVFPLPHHRTAEEHAAAAEIRASWKVGTLESVPCSLLAAVSPIVEARRLLPAHAAAVLVVHQCFRSTASSHAWAHRIEEMR